MLSYHFAEDHARGLSVFSMMAGFGGFFGYASTGIDWDKTIIGDFFGGNIKTVFGIVIILIFLSSVVSLTSFREIPLPLLEGNELLRPLTQAAVKQELDRKKNTVVIVKEVREFKFNCRLHICVSTVCGRVGTMQPVKMDFPLSALILN